ncbi:MAG: bifunctional [glutamine synthetase] adenylyltransferase/[glutamine synthetase]-adenylyl-L-tyrosine phosphorylase [Hyphomicrobiaceae bacterium]
MSEKSIDNRALYELFQDAPIAIDDDARAEDVLGELLLDTNSPSGASEDLADLVSKPRVKALLLGTIQASPYLTGLMRRDSERLVRILKSPPQSYFDTLTEKLFNDVSTCGDKPAAMAKLRAYKNEVALLTALADLSDAWPVMNVTRILAQTADAALQASLGFLFAQAVKSGTWAADVDDVADAIAQSGFFVLAMGKHGAFELNYSSDIDLIVFYDRDRAKQRLCEGQEDQGFFVRLTQNLVALMQERTADGYVFRTDLRLRPDPGATPVALPTVAALGYYETTGQNWERAAMIKARCAAGDMEAGATFLDDVKPFIWRRHLDFAAISDIHAMKRQIHAFRGFEKIAVAGHNIKLGRGGIREIEFFVQTQQLIAGGRQPDLRGQETLKTLETLVEKGWITPEVCRDLDEAYRYLRRLEHRVQMIADEQTHTLPSQPEALERLARFSGVPDVDKFASELLVHLGHVQTHYAALFEDTVEQSSSSANMVFAGSDEDPETVETLAGLGFSRPKDVISIIKGWHTGRYPATRSEQAREKLTVVQPLLVEALAETADPDRALITFDRFLSELPAGIQLFSLLNQHPGLLRLISDIMGTAPRLASILARRRRLLDAVIDPRTFGPEALSEDLDNVVASEISRAEDFQDVLDRARIVGSEQAFLIGVRVLSGNINAKQAGAAYARLAERMIDALLLEAKKDLGERHGQLPGGETVVLAMGKLGGVEMTASSDLDLIMVYEYPDGVLETDGQRSLDPVTYYTRLTQRLINMLSAPTVEGALYEVDLRLRPSGHQGPVATRLKGFVDYQANKAWTWEHMALTRARVVAGPEELKRAVEDAIYAALTQKRDRAKLVADVLEMRERIQKEKGSDDIWDLKTVRGGLIDLEFIAQFLQMAHAADHPEILSPNTITVFENLKASGILDDHDADFLIQAAMKISDLTQILKLCLSGPLNPTTCPKGLLDLLAAAGDAPDFSILESDLKQILTKVHEAFERLISN